MSKEWRTIAHFTWKTWHNPKFSKISINTHCMGKNTQKCCQSINIILIIDTSRIKLNHVGMAICHHNWPIPSNDNHSQQSDNAQQTTSRDVRPGVKVRAAHTFLSSTWALAIMAAMARAEWTCISVTQLTLKSLSLRRSRTYLLS